MVICPKQTTTGKEYFMNYFKLLGIIFGTAALLKPFYMHILPWDENRFIAKAYKKKRPRWVIPVALAGIAFVAFTWYKELTTNIRYSIVLTILFSLTSVKAVLFLFDYENFQKWVAGMLSRDEGKQIVVVDIFTGVFGLVVITLSLVLL